MTSAVAEPSPGAPLGGLRTTGLPASGLPTHAHAPLDRPLVDRTAAAALALLPGVGPVRWRALITTHRGDGARAATAYGATTAAWSRALQDAAELLQPPDALTTVLVAGDPDYPSPLLDLADAPPLLWVRGRLDALAVVPAVAFVGTRHNTAAGAHATRRLVAAIRETGACVVSGLARGIDGVAHEAALDAGLATVAVLATGADVPYPAQHRALYSRILGAGAAVSEHPPGTAAVPGAFPRRNRIIAALAVCTVVVEAPERSGALITADFALELGRTVAAVPGPIDTPAAAGTNALLRDGAHVLATVDDLPPLLRGPSAGTCQRTAAQTSPAPHARPSRDHRKPTRSAPPRPALDGDELTLWDALAEPALDGDVAAVRAGLSARRCAAALTSLELRGVVATELSGAIRRL